MLFQNLYNFGACIFVCIGTNVAVNNVYAYVIRCVHWYAHAHEPEEDIAYPAASLYTLVPWDSKSRESVDEQSPEILWFLGSSALELHVCGTCLDFYVGTGDLNSVLYAITINAITHEAKLIFCLK